MTANPWNMPRREQEVLAGMVSTGGCQKIVASVLGISVKTVDTYLSRARIRMEVRTRIEALLRWDRWVNQQRERA